MFYGVQAILQLMAKVHIHDEFCHLWCNAISLNKSSLMFWRHMLPPSLGLKGRPSKEQQEAGGKQDGSSFNLQNCGELLQSYTTLHPRR
jgi:hypothetical protein